MPADAAPPNVRRTYQEQNPKLADYHCLICGRAWYGVAIGTPRWHAENDHSTKMRLERRRKPLDSGSTARRKESSMKGRQQWRDERTQENRGGAALAGDAAAPHDVCSILPFVKGPAVVPSRDGAVELLGVSKDEFRHSIFYKNQYRTRVAVDERADSTYTLGVVVQRHPPDAETGVQRPASGSLISFECLFQSHGSGLVRAEVDAPCFTGEQSVAFNCVRFRAAQIARLLGVKQLNGLDGTCDVQTRSMPSSITKTGSSVGCAFVASFVAAASGLSVDKHTVFTGAIDLRGNILEVGDVVLKARTAKENGANRFVCPSENVRRHMTPDVLRTAGLEGLEVMGVRSLKELLTVALLPRGHRQANRSDAPCNDNDGLSSGMYLGSAYSVTNFSDGDAYRCGNKQEIQVMLIEVPGGRGGRILCTGAPPSMPPLVSLCIAFIKSRPQIFKARPGLHLDDLHTPRYDIHVHLPPSMPRTETYLGSALYLAMISAVTGWVADPQVAIMGEVSLSGLLPGCDLLGSADLRAIHSANVGIKHLIAPQTLLDRCKSFLDSLNLRPENPKVTFHGAESILEVLDLVFPSLEANPQGSISQPRSTKRQPAAPSAAALDATPAARPGWGLVNAMKQLQAYLPFKF